MRKEMDREKIPQLLEIIKSVFSISDLRENGLFKATCSDIGDYEDAIQSECASRIKADYIVTRNLKDYRNSKVPAIKPSELLKQL